MEPTAQDEKDAALLIGVYAVLMRSLGTLGLVCSEVAEFLEAHEAIGGTTHIFERHVQRQTAVLRACSQEAEDLIRRLAKTDRESFREAAEELIAEKDMT